MAATKSKRTIVAGAMLAWLLLPGLAHASDQNGRLIVALSPARNTASFQLITRGRVQTAVRPLASFIRVLRNVSAKPLDAANAKTVQDAMQGLGLDSSFAPEALVAFVQELAAWASAESVSGLSPEEMQAGLRDGQDFLSAYGCATPTTENPLLSAVRRADPRQEVEAADTGAAAGEPSDASSFDANSYAHEMMAHDSMRDQLLRGEDQNSDFIAPPEREGNCDRTCQQSGGSGNDGGTRYGGITFNWDMQDPSHLSVSSSIGPVRVVGWDNKGGWSVGPALPNASSGENDGGKESPSGNEAPEGGGQEPPGGGGSAPGNAPSGDTPPSNGDEPEPTASNDPPASGPGDFNSPADGDPRVAMPSPEGGGNSAWARAHLWRRFFSPRNPDPVVYPSEESGGARGADALSRGRVRYDIDCDTAASSEHSDDDSGDEGNRCGASALDVSEEPNYGVVDPPE